MKNFCTDIIETAKIRGIGRNGNGCSNSRRPDIYTYTITHSHTTEQIVEETITTTTYTYRDGSSESKTKKLKKIFSYK